MIRKLYQFSTSIGVVIYPLDSVEEKLSVPTLLSYAERAMTYSKLISKKAILFLAI